MNARWIVALLPVSLVICSFLDAPVAASSPEPSGNAASPAPAPDEGPMCLEHGVLEAVCTKCNPRLATVFRAKGDWCAEHGYPESFCPICKPQRRGRPVADVTDDGAPPDGREVKLKSPEVARAAGIETVRTYARTSQPQVDALVRLVHDATRVASINARSAGVVREVEAQVGAFVARGQALAVIQSAGVGADRSRLEAARARLKVAGAGRERERSLYRQGAVAQKEVLVSEQEWASAKAELDTASAALRLVDQAGAEGRTILEAPIAGVVTRRRVCVGQLVDTSSPLFEIVDTRVIWAIVEVPEADVTQVKKGQMVVIRIDTLPGREFAGPISYLVPEVDRESRTVAALVELTNPEGLLLANMYGRARIFVGDRRSVVPVPRGALQRTKEIQVVFVRKGPTLFVLRRVTVGAIDQTAAELLLGVRAGEDVVTTGAFLLKTETLKESIGAGCCAVE